MPAGDCRITSYNVCYTKLLRLPLAQTRPFAKGTILSLGPTLVQLLYIFPYQAKKGYLGLELGVLTPVFVLRITSYNVCYTKLLRVLIQGQVQKDEQSVKILAEKVVPMDKAEETWTASIHLNLEISRTDLV